MSVCFVNSGLDDCAHFWLVGFFHEVSFQCSLLKLMLLVLILTMQDIVIFSGKICRFAFLKGQFLYSKSTAGITVGVHSHSKSTCSCVAFRPALVVLALNLQ